MPRGTNLIFIVGCPRSGTTLLLRNLNNHSKIQFAGETNFLTAIWGNRHIFNISRRLGSNLLLSRLQDFFNTNIQSFVDGYHGFNYSPWINELEFSDWINEFKHNKIKNYSNLYVSFMKVIARKRKKPIFGDKVTWYFRDVHTLLSLYPEAKIINAVRDGRAVVSSMLHRSVPSEIPNNLIDMCLLWKRSILLAKTYRKTMPKTSYYEIKYENLVTYPKRELKRLCNFLGIAFERNMMSIEGSTNSAYKDVKTKGMDKTLLTKWKEKLDHTQIGLIEYIIRKELQNEGYKCLTSPNENLEFDKKLEIIIRSMIYRARRFKKETLNRMGFGAVSVPMLLRNLSRIYARSLASPRFFGRKQIRYIGH